MLIESSSASPTAKSDNAKSTTCDLPVEFRTSRDDSQLPKHIRVVEVANQADLDAAKRHFQLPYPPTVAKLERGPRDPAVVVSIKLSHLDLNDKYQARVVLDLNHVDELQKSDYLDPIEVFVLPSGRLAVTDGRHRIEVAKQRRDVIRAVLWRGTDVDAQLRALEVNTKHGLMLSLDDKRKAGIRYLKLREDATDTELALKLGLNTKTVKKIRNDLAAESSAQSTATAAPKPTIRTDKNGHTRVVTGKRAKPKAKAAAERRVQAARREPVARPSAYDQAIELVKSACKLMQGQPVGDIKSFVTFTTLKLSELEPTNV